MDSSLNSLVQRIPGVRRLMKVLGRTTYELPAAYLDVRSAWPLADGSVDVVYASHLFEHLTMHDGQTFLREARRVLRPSGVLRLVVPDLYALAKQYVRSFEQGDSEASVPFLFAINLHREQAYGAHRSLLVRLLNGYQGYPHQHKYMYDSASLSAMIRAEGFVDVRSGTYGCSEYIPEILDVENTKEGQPSIYLEAKR